MYIYKNNWVIILVIWKYVYKDTHKKAEIKHFLFALRSAGHHFNGR